jgi:uncharacterized protein (DUF433 family)
MTDTPKPTINHIEIVDGKPVIKSRNVKVKMIARMYLAEGITIDDVMEQYNLTPAQVHAAMAYYYDHIEYFKQLEQDEEALLEPIKQESAERLAKLRARMEVIKAEQRSEDV